MKSSRRVNSVPKCEFMEQYLLFPTRCLFLLSAMCYPVCGFITCRVKPKSIRCTRLDRSPNPIKVLLGFKLQWIMNLECINSRRSKNCRKSISVVLRLKRCPHKSRRFWSDGPRSGITIKMHFSSMEIPYSIRVGNPIGPQSVLIACTSLSKWDSYSSNDSVFKAHWRLFKFMSWTA